MSLNPHRAFLGRFSSQFTRISAAFVFVPQQKVLFSGTSARPKGETYACWNCDHKNTVFCLFCEKCQHVIDPNEVKEGRLDYFEVLGLPRKFELSRKMISSSFRALQAKLHPDRFAVASEKEQAISSDTSSLVNQAYSVLKNPHTRGLHLLELHGMSLEEGDVATDPEFLMELMEINEEISEEVGPERLREIHAENERRIAKHAEQLAQVFKKQDYAEARRILAEMKYFDNIAEKLANSGVGKEG